MYLYHLLHLCGTKAAVHLETTMAEGQQSQRVFHVLQFVLSGIVTSPEQREPAGLDVPRSATVRLPRVLTDTATTSRMCSVYLLSLQRTQLCRSGRRSKPTLF